MHYGREQYTLQYTPRLSEGVPSWFVNLFPCLDVHPRIASPVVLKVVSHPFKDEKSLVQKGPEVLVL